MQQKTSFSLGISPLPDNPDFVKFNKTFKETIDIFCKLEKPKLTKRTFSNNPWITEGIIISITYKETLYNTWKRTRTKRLPDGDHDAHSKYSEYHKNLKHVITLAKESFSQKKILDNVNNHKKTWAAINQLRGKNKESMRPSFIINNERIIERRIIADEFNKYFVSLAPNMNKSLSPDKNDDILNFKTFIPGSNPNSIFLYDCSAEEISKIISELENGKSSDIPVKIIKKSTSL